MVTMSSVLTMSCSNSRTHLRQTVGSGSTRRASFFSSWRCILFFFVLAIVLATSEAAPIQLTDDNVEDHLLGKKASFILFYGSKCVDCIDISPEWNKLANEWSNHPYGQILKVDCEASDTEAICDYFQISEVPTLAFGGSMEWDFYHGEMDYESLASFAKTTISKPICSARVPENCQGKDLQVLEMLQKKSNEELLAMQAVAQSKMDDLYQTFQLKEAKLTRQREEPGQRFGTSYGRGHRRVRLSIVIGVLQKRLQEASPVAGGSMGL